MDIMALEKFSEYLGLQKEPPTLDFLERILPVYLEKVPYESLSKILFTDPDSPKFVSLSEYVDRLEEFGFGGTCFANNIYFGELLKYLGFRAELNSVDTRDSKDSHVACKILIDGKSYIVDLGNMSHFSGPFLL